MWMGLHSSHRRFHVVNREPGRRGLQLAVDVFDVLHALGFKPFAESSRSLFRIDGNALFPCGASAEHAVKLHARFAGQLQRLTELRVAHARREIDRWLPSSYMLSVRQMTWYLRRTSCSPELRP